MYDAIVVGARCAGAPTAMLLARKGYRVLLVDRATFPSDLPNGHFVHVDGPRCLHRWGLLDRVLATGCPPITALVTDHGDFPLVGRDLVAGGIPAGLAPRRWALDTVLVDAAVEAGAELREGFAVQEFLAEGERIVGIRGRERGGPPVAERARVVVGADGRNSRLARTVGAPAYEAAPPVAFYYFSYWGGVPGEAQETYARDECVVFTMPTNDGLLGIFVGWPRAELPRVRAGIEAEFLAAIDRVPALTERVRAGRRVERFYGATDLPNFFRKPYGPGWALVGDAGYHKDPFRGLGAGDALRDTELLAAALDAGLSGRRPVEEAMAEYERQRNEAALPKYRENLERARFLPLTEAMMQLRRALRERPEDARRFYMAYEGMVPRESFFNRENLERLTAAPLPPAR